MQNELDPKGLLAAMAAYHKSMGNLSGHANAVETAIRTYLSAVPDGEGELVEAAARRIAENHWSVDFEGTKAEYVESHWLYHVDDAKAALAARKAMESGE